MSCEIKLLGNNGLVFNLALISFLKIISIIYNVLNVIYKKFLI